MVSQAQGALVGLMLLAAAGLSGLPSDMVGFGVVLACSLLLDRFQLSLGRNISFNPALPVVLGGSLVPQIGALVGLVFVFVQALSDLAQPFLSTLSRQTALAFALLVVGLGQRFAWEPDWLLLALAPALYLVVRWYTLHTGPPASDKEKQLWYHLHLRIRPLELGFAAAAPLVALGCRLSPFTALLFLPLLATGRLAAENVLLRSHDQSLDDLLKALKSTADREKKAETSLKKERQEKQILEGFASMLSGRPETTEICAALLDTTQALMSCDSAAVFLGDPPSPFYYRAQSEQTSRLQGAALTGLREPVVDRARERARPIHQRQAPEEPNRLFHEDAVAAAVPLGKSGVLYLGRGRRQPFSKEELEQLSWLSKKAEMALDVSFRQQESLRRQRSLHQAVQTLEHRVAWMNQLMKATERLVSTLSSDELMARFESVLSEAVPHHSGFLHLATVSRVWGDGHQPPEALVEFLTQTAQTVHFEELSKTPHGASNPYGSMLSSPIQSGETRLGLVVLFHREPKAFSRQKKDLLYLLASQAAMAMTNSQLYEEVVEARKQLQESQARLVQSSKMTSMGQLAAGVAHELNSPIGAISLSLEEAIAQVDSKPEFVKMVLKIAMEAVERSKEIIDRLMGYTRSSVGKMEKLVF